MGTKVKLKSDPALAQRHEDGAKVALVQPAVHLRYGPLWVAQPAHLQIHLGWAGRMRAQLTEIDARIEALDVGTGGGRSVNDPALVSDLYLAGADLAIHTVLALQHLVRWLEALSPASLGTDDLMTRMAAALKRLGYRTDLSTDVRYARLHEIEARRHSIEHPTPDNVSTNDPNGWDLVPLTWIASGKAASAFDGAIEFIREIAGYASRVERRRKGSTTLDVTRGIKATNDARKPRGRGGV